MLAERCGVVRLPEFNISLEIVSYPEGCRASGFGVMGPATQEDSLEIEHSCPNISRVVYDGDGKHNECSVFEFYGFTRTFHPPNHSHLDSLHTIFYLRLVLAVETFAPTGVCTRLRFSELDW